MSRNTLPLLSVMRTGRLAFLGVFVIISVLPFLMVAFSICKPLVDEADFLLRCNDARFRFLLECMKHVYGILKPDCVDRAPCIAVIGRDNLKYTAPAKPLQRLR